jgi:hypothetical protein
MLTPRTAIVSFARTAVGLTSAMRRVGFVVTIVEVLVCDMTEFKK